MKSINRVVVFGASGSIGNAICLWFLDRGWEVVAISRSPQASENKLQRVSWLVWDPFTHGKIDSEGVGALDAAVWAQGQNFNDNIQTFDASSHEEMYRANVVYVIQSLHILLAQGLLSTPSRLCIISSIWQNIARQNKLSYTVSKSALQGLVQSLAIDLGKDGHLINAVLPGALDTPMTRANLSAEQVNHIEESTPLKHLATLDDVCNLAGFLCSPDNSGITGQFIAADRGFSYARIL